MAKSYLGDGAYVDFDGFGLTLTTEDGISVQNTIYLEPQVYRALTEYVERLKQQPEPSGWDDGRSSDEVGRDGY